MNWSMPRPVLQAVAALIGAACLGSFVLGALSAPDRGRLPGQRLDGATGQPIQAVEATPLSDDRIEGVAPTTELSDEEKARIADEKEAREEAALAAKAAAAGITPVNPAPPPPAAPAEKVETQQVPPASPKQEEPPF